MFYKGAVQLTQNQRDFSVAGLRTQESSHEC
jgi:hypothetical protein